MAITLLDSEAKKKIRKIVDGLPVNGQWKDSNNRTPYVQLALALYTMNWKFEDIKLFLQDLYYAVANEYGGA